MIFTQLCYKIDRSRVYEIFRTWITHVSVFHILKIRSSHSTVILLTPKMFSFADFSYGRHISTSGDGRRFFPELKKFHSINHLDMPRPLFVTIAEKNICRNFEFGTSYLFCPTEQHRCDGRKKYLSKYLFFGNQLLLCFFLISEGDTVSYCLFFRGNYSRAIKC